MDVLLIEKDPLVRDQAKIGLQQFPEFTVTLGDGHAGVNELRGRPFDCVMLGVDPADKDTIKLLQYLRSFDPSTELVVLVPERHAREFAAEKAKYDIHTLLQKPLQPREFFGFVGRFLDRRTDRNLGAIRKRTRPPVTGNRRG